jgi:hypothetical protein
MGVNDFPSVFSPEFTQPFIAFDSGASMLSRYPSPTVLPLLAC